MDELGKVCIPGGVGGGRGGLPQFIMLFCMFAIWDIRFAFAFYTKNIESFVAIAGIVFKSRPKPPRS